VSQQVFNGLVATVVGMVVAILLLAPTAAVQYRRDGRLGPLDLVTLIGAAVYGLALWTYTLLPFPIDNTFACRARQLEVLGSFRPVFEQGLLGPAQLLHNVAFMQLALNVLLFVPLGFFVRLVLHRGIIVTTILGFAISLAIETTQLTGVWHLYHCAYRVFDVDDLLVNTAGAFVGGVLAKVLIKRYRPAKIVLPTTISLGRRWVGFLSDAVFIWATGVAAIIAWRGYSVYGQGKHWNEVDATMSTVVQLALPLLIEGFLVLATGRTVGEWAIDVRSVPHGNSATFVRRLVKLVLGVGAFTVVLALKLPGANGVLAGIILVTLAASLRTKQHRGLTHWAAGMDLVIDFDAEPKSQPPADDGVSR
jgi:glycopeptide antibiotics resistance protein